MENKDNIKDNPKENIKEELVIKEKNNKIIKPIEECSICLELLKYEISTLSCHHEYHFKCLYNWQKKKGCLKIVCPICRQEVEIIYVSDKHKKSESASNFYDIDLNTNEDFNKMNELNDRIDNRTSQFLLFNCCSIL